MKVVETIALGMLVIELVVGGLLFIGNHQNSSSDAQLTPNALTTATAASSTGSDYVWTQSINTNSYSLYGVSMLSGSDGWAVGAQGTILHYTGGQWQEVSSPTTNTLLSIAMVSATLGWAVGENGTILHYVGAQLSAYGWGLEASWTIRASHW
jgi:hypothetical protein